LFEVSVPGNRLLQQCRREIKMLKQVTLINVLTHKLLNKHANIIFLIVVGLHIFGPNQHRRMEDDSLERHRCGKHGHGMQEVFKRHSRSGQGDEVMGRIQWLGIDCQEHADLPARRGRTAESGHQRSSLAAACFRNKGILIIV